MGFLNSTGDEKRLLPVRLFFQPTRNRSSILAIFVLFVGQSARAVSRRSLGIALRFGLLSKSPPGLAILRQLHGAILSLKLLPSLRHHGKIVVVETVKLIPGDLAMFMTRRVKHLPYTPRPITILLKKLWHRKRPGAGLANIGLVINHSTRLWLESIQKRSPRRTAHRILAKSSVEGHGFRGKLRERRGFDVIVSGRRNVGVEIIADDQKNVPLVPLFLSSLRLIFGSIFFTLLALTNRLTLTTKLFSNRTLGSRWRPLLTRRLSALSI